MHLDDAIDVYQDTFLAAWENIRNNNVRPDTNWYNYIFFIGSRIAAKKMHHGAITDPFTFIVDEDRGKSAIALRVEKELKELANADTPIGKDPEVLSRLGKELDHTPETCREIIRLAYYSELSMEEIAEKVGLKNAATARVRKNQCMQDLIERVTKSLNNAGYNLKPKSKKGKRDGKN